MYIRIIQGIQGELKGLFMIYYDCYHGLLGVARVVRVTSLLERKRKWHEGVLSVSKGSGPRVNINNPDNSPHNPLIAPGWK